VADCPPGWDVVDLDAFPVADDHWLYEGDLGAVDHTWGDCDEHGPDRAHRFTAPAAGLYRFGLSGDRALTFHSRRLCGVEGDRGDGDACDPAASERVTASLAAGDVLYLIVDSLAPPADAGYAIQVEREPFVVERAEAFWNPDAGSFGLRLEGTGDGMAGLAQLHGWRVTAAGDEVGYVDPGVDWSPRPPVTQAGADFRFEASVTGSSAYFWQPGLDGRDAVAAQLVALSVERLEVPLQPPRRVPLGAECDEHRALDVCPAGAVCLRDAPDARPTCQERPTACPAGWDVVDLNAHPSADGGWSHAGTTAGRPSLADGCRFADPPVGVPEAVHAFVAPVAGVYAFVADAPVVGRATQLYVRSHCGEGAPGAELACSEVGRFADRRQSPRLVRLALEAGQQVFVFVDGSRPDDPGGDYTLAVHLECGR
jgi:hypothetical protein